MSIFRWLRAIALAAAVTCPAALVLAQTEDQPPFNSAPFQGSLAGQLLVSAPGMGDPRFDNTVILMVRHDKDGAFGVVINRPVEEQPVAEVLKWIGESGDGIEGKIRLFAGGPVQPGVGLVIHTADYHLDQTMTVDRAISVTSDPKILKDIGHGHGPKKAFMAFGYAGWGAGQLDWEVGQHDWAPVPDDPQLVFDEQSEKVWAAAWARRSISL